MKKLSAVLLALLLLFTFAACGGSSNKYSGAPDPAPEMSVGEYESPAYDAASPSASSAADLSLTGRKLIFNADVSAETKEFDQAKADLDALIGEFDGYTESSDLSGSSYDGSRTRRRLSYSIRVPAASLEDFLSRLDDIMNVTSRSTNMSDVTNAYVDVEARLNNLKKEEARLLELLEQTGTLEELLQLESRLSEVRYEIESMTSRIRAYDNEIAYSTVTLRLNDVTEYTVSVTFGSRISEAFSGGWNSFGDLLQDLAVGVVWALPFLLLLGAAVVVILLLVRRSLKKQKRRFPAASQPPAVPPQTPPADPSKH